MGGLPSPQYPRDNLDHGTFGDQWPGQNYLPCITWTCKTRCFFPQQTPLRWVKHMVNTHSPQWHEDGDQVPGCILIVIYIYYVHVFHVIWVVQKWDHTVGWKYDVSKLLTKGFQQERRSFFPNRLWVILVGHLREMTGKNVGTFPLDLMDVSFVVLG